MKRRLNAQPNQSLIDGIATLQALANADRPVGNRELARQLGLEPTRVNRLLRTLVYLGVANQTANRKYTPGPGMHVIAAQSLYASGLLRRALHPLEMLMDRGYLVALGVLWRDSVAYLFHADPNLKHKRGVVGSYALYPATQSGIGMALMADMDADEIVEIYQDRPSIPNFPEGLDQLMAELDRIRARGYAYTFSSEEKNHYTVGVTVDHPTDCAIGFSGAISAQEAPKLAEVLRQSALLIEAGEDATGG